MVDNLKTHLPKAPPVGKGDDPFGTMFVSTAMAKVFDARSDEPRAKVATLFKPLAVAELCPPAELTRAFELALEFIDDEVIDVPMIARYMAQFIARAVADKLLPLAFIADGFAHLVDASSVTATKMAVEVLKALSEDVGDADATALYRDSKVDLSKLLLPADAAAAPPSPRCSSAGSASRGRARRGERARGGGGEPGGAARVAESHWSPSSRRSRPPTPRRSASGCGRRRLTLRRRRSPRART